MRGFVCVVAAHASLLTGLSGGGGVAEPLRLRLKIVERKTKGIDIVWNRLRSRGRRCSAQVSVVSTSIKALSRIEVETQFDGIIDGFLDLGGKIVAMIAKIIVEVVERIAAGYRRATVDFVAMDVNFGRFLLLCS